MPPVAEAYGALLTAAPMARLQAGLASAIATTAPGARPGWKGLRPAAIAAGLALFALGTLAGGVAPTVWSSFVATDQTGEAGEEAWRDAVADYVGLTTSQTLLAMRPSSDQLLTDLRRALAKADVTIDPNAFRLPGRSLMRVELYHYNNEPLVQLAFLDEENGPISLCITKRAGPVEAPESERRKGMNIAYWSTPTHAFMLISRAPDEVLQKLAADVAPRTGGPAPPG
jgi:hypothetical protein